MAGRLVGTRALVTGGASGIGGAITERFRAEAAQVVAADLSGGDVACDPNRLTVRGTRSAIAVRHPDDPRVTSVTWPHGA